MVSTLQADLSKKPNLENASQNVSSKIDEISGAISQRSPNKISGCGHVNSGLQRQNSVEFHDLSKGTIVNQQKRAAAEENIHVVKLKEVVPSENGYPESVSDTKQQLLNSLRENTNLGPKSRAAESLCFGPKAQGEKISHFAEKSQSSGLNLEQCLKNIH